MNSNERVIVTGGAGFIGSHIADAYLAAGCEVAVLDNFASGSRDNIPTSAQVHEIDISHREAVEHVFREFQPTIVNHHAAQASVYCSVQSPADDARTNIMGTLNLLDAAVEVKTKKFIFASTGGAIYGEIPDGQRATTEMLPDPQSPYAMSKLAAERYINWYEKNHPLECRILRYANVYGPRQSPEGEAGVVAIFLQRLTNGEPLQVNARSTRGDAGCVRDYVYIDDVVAANMAASTGPLSLPVCNVCTSVGTTTLKLAEMLKGITGSDSTIEYGDCRPGDVEYSVLDATVFSQSIQQPTTIADGLNKTASWFQQSISS